MDTVLISPEAAISLEDTQDLRLLIWPELDFSEPESSSLVDEAIENLFGYDWLVLKNVRAAEYFLRRLEMLSATSVLDDLRVLAIAEETITKVIEFHVHVDIALDRFPPAEALPALKSFASDPLAGLNFLIPCANITAESFEVHLQDAGARIDSVTAYLPTKDIQSLTRLKALLAGGGIDFVAFQRPSEIEEFARLFDTDDLGRLLLNVGIACQDEETRGSALQFGLTHATDQASSVFASIRANQAMS
jgi:uroporphyrinogen-III synthase